MQRSVYPLRLALILFGSLAALLVPSAGAQSTTPDTTLQPWQVATLETVTAAAVSPDGETIAFVRAVPRKPLEEDSGPAWTELWVLGADGEARGYVTGPGNVRGVAWRGTEELTFVAKRGDDEHRSLYAIPLRGGEARKLLEAATDISSYALSADGNTVAFLATEEEDPERKALEKKGFNQEIYEEDDAYTRLFVADLGAASDGPLEPRQLDVEGSVRSVRMSPDGRRLVITVTPTPLVDDTYVAQRIRVLDPNGKVTAEIENPGKLGAIAISPDGETLAMVSAADRNDPAAGRLMVVPASGGALRDLLPGLEGHVSQLAWLDSETLLYIADRGTETEIGKVRADGSNQEIVVPSGQAVATALAVPAGGSRGTAAVIAQSPAHPAELFTLALDTGALERRTESNEWLEGVRLAEQETIRYRARDGLELEGILIYPLDYRKGQRYPLVMIVHGGPESHYRNGWLTSYSNMGQLAAARGFAVFYPNYRGSTGRGVEFSKISQADAAGPEFDDLVDGVDHLIEIGLVDRNQVGITGGSYGGYASAWATTYYSDRFAAAIPFVGISDNISKVGTTDIPHEMFDVHHRKWLWEDWDYFAERSPIYYVKRNRTPTLILHGKNDPRVHPSQSMELYRHLKVLGQAPVRLVFYPGEGHGNRKSAARFDYMLRTIRWMERYVGGPGGPAPDPTIDYAPFLPWANDDDGDTGAGDATETPSASG